LELEHLLTNPIVAFVVLKNANRGYAWLPLCGGTGSHKVGMFPLFFVKWRRFVTLEFLELNEILIEI